MGVSGGRTSGALGSSALRAVKSHSGLWAMFGPRASLKQLEWKMKDKGKIRGQREKSEKMGSLPSEHILQSPWRVSVVN